MNNLNKNSQMFFYKIKFLILVSSVICLYSNSALAFSNEEMLNAEKQIATAQQESATSSQFSSSVLDNHKIDYKSVLFEIPKTSLLGLEMGFSKKSVPWWGLILTSTMVLYHNDEVILRDVQKVGRDVGLGNEDNTKGFIKAGQFDLIRLPTDTGSLLYFLGDGWTHFGIAGAFLYNGINNNNTRAYNTSLRMVHGMAVSTIFNQFLKRSFGRESPYVRTEDKGKWSPYPSVKEYQTRTAKYDAMPSGHIMTATVNYIIILDSYPEYSNIIHPVAWTWMTLLGTQMVNNGVHWASDYPLGIGMGYVFGKAAMKLGQPQEFNSAQTREPKAKWFISPYRDYYTDGLAFNIQY